MIRRINTSKVITKTQRVLLPHAKVVGLVLRGLLEMFGRESEESSRVSRPRRGRSTPFRTALPSHAHMDRNVIRTE